MQYFGNFLRISCGEQTRSYYFLTGAALIFMLFACSENFAQTMLDQSISAVKSHKTIECNIRMTVWVDGVEFASRGRYEEQAILAGTPGNFLRSMYRLDINSISDVALAPGTDPNRMTLVCHVAENRDNSQIWQYKSVENKKELHIIRTVPLETAIRNSKKRKDLSSIAEVENLGGLAATLRQIAKIYEFSEPVESDWAGTPDRSLWKVSGTVRKERHEELLKLFGGADKKGKLPSDFPSDIELHVGQKDFFPYKIIYLNRPAENSKTRTPLSETAYYDVILNGEPIPAGNFALFSENGERPEGVFNFQDDTNLVIRSLGL